MEIIPCLHSLLLPIPLHSFGLVKNASPANDIQIFMMNRIIEFKQYMPYNMGSLSFLFLGDLLVIPIQD